MALLVSRCFDLGKFFMKNSLKFFSFWLLLALSTVTVVFNSCNKDNDSSPAGWRVFTSDEINTLLDTDKVSNEWITQNSITGRKFTDKTTGNSIFLPAAGYRYGIDGTFYYVGSYGFYWSSMQNDSNFVYYLYFYSGFAAAFLPLSFVNVRHSDEERNLALGISDYAEQRNKIKR